jgi:hypothetical protein
VEALRPLAAARLRASQTAAARQWRGLQETEEWEAGPQRGQRADARQWQAAQRRRPKDAAQAEQQ